MKFKTDVVRVILEREDIKIIEQFVDLMTSICGGTELNSKDEQYCSRCPLTHMCTTDDIFKALDKIPNTKIEIKESST